MKCPTMSFMGAHFSIVALNQNGPVKREVKNICYIFEHLALTEFL